MILQTLIYGKRLEIRQKKYKMNEAITKILLFIHLKMLGSSIQ